MDGSVTAGVIGQLAAVPNDATHLISASGETTFEEGLIKLAQIQNWFQQEYGQMLDWAQKRKLPVVVCMVYDPRFLEQASADHLCGAVSHQ